MDENKIIKQDIEVVIESIMSEQPLTVHSMQKKRWQEGNMKLNAKIDIISKKGYKYEVLVFK